MSDLYRYTKTKAGLFLFQWKNRVVNIKSHRFSETLLRLNSDLETEACSQEKQPFGIMSRYFTCT